MRELRQDSKQARRPKLTVLGNLQGKQRRRHIQKMKTRPCRKIEMFGRAKVKVRGKQRRVSGTKKTENK